MAINPISYTPGQAYSGGADFSQLANLGNVYRMAQEQQNQQAVLSQLGQDPNTDAMTLLKSGSLPLAQLGIQARNRLTDQSREDARYAITDPREERRLALAGNADRRAGAAESRAAQDWENDSPEFRRKQAIEQGLDLKNPAVQNYIITGQQFPDPTSAAAANKAGLNPFFGTRKGPDGQDVTVMMQPTGTAEALETKLPEGVTVSNKPIVADLGDSIAYIDPVTRQTLRVVPKNIENKAAQEVTGEGRGKAKLALPQVEATSGMLLDQIDKVAGHKGKQYALGAYSMLPTVPGTSQADFRAALDQLKGGTFLQAFNTLKGGGAITEIEGEKATNALLRAQTAQTQAGFDEAMRDFRGYVQGGLDRAKSAARGGASTGQGSGADDALSRANAAIASGKDPAAVRQRLIEQGVDPGNIGK